MNPRLGTTPAESSWERPQRPEAPTPPRWPWIAFWLVIASLGAGGWFAFAPEGDETDPGTSSTSATGGGDGTGETGMPEDGFAILHASWGTVDDTPAPAAPEPQNPTEWQKREQAFHEMGRDRWKGTELFVRRDAR